MLKKAFGWLIAALIAVGLSGCFDGDNDKPKPAVITQQPVNATVAAGTTATFTATATGKKLTYQWQRGLTAIAGATGASYTTPATTVADDGATFRVVITNRGRQRHEQRCDADRERPSRHHDATCECDRRRGRYGDLQRCGNRHAPVLPVAARRHEHPRCDEREVYHGRYDRCRRRGDVPRRNHKHAGRLSSAATLNVNVPPAITTPPANASVDVGATATFSAVATGTRLSYQWQRGTTDIAGATSATYTTPVTAGYDDGATFRVVVTNAAGVVTSAAATLTVDRSGHAAFDIPHYADGLRFRQGGIALKADGTVWAWGLNSSGEAGQGNHVVPGSGAGHDSRGPADPHHQDFGRLVLRACARRRRQRLDLGRIDHACAAVGADGHPSPWRSRLHGGGRRAACRCRRRGRRSFVSAVVLADGRVMVWGEGEEGWNGPGLDDDGP